MYLFSVHSRTNQMCAKRHSNYRNDMPRSKEAEVPIRRIDARNTVCPVFLHEQLPAMMIVCRTKWMPIRPRKRFGIFGEET